MNESNSNLPSVRIFFFWTLTNFEQTIFWLKRRKLFFVVVGVPWRSNVRMSLTFHTESSSTLLWEQAMCVCEREWVRESACVRESERVCVRMCVTIVAPDKGSEFSAAAVAVVSSNFCFPLSTRFPSPAPTHPPFCSHPTPSNAALQRDGLFSSTCYHNAYPRSSSWLNAPTHWRTYIYSSLSLSITHTHTHSPHSPSLCFPLEILFFWSKDYSEIGAFPQGKFARLS